ncbi:hypothetical protein U0070_001684, partial [Myodes glareolus]
LEDTYGCPYDFVEVFDGKQVASLSMGKVCAGAELTFLSSSNSMTVVFKSDAMITNTGFCALYNTVHQDERQNDVKVVCQQLGCGVAMSTPTESDFEGGMGHIMLDDVQCMGDEAKVWHCTHHGWFSHNCGHHEDASVVCSGIDDTSSRGPAAQLSCLPLLFQAVIDRGYLRRLGYSSWDIHLNDRMCRPQVTGRYLIFNIPYGHCGTIRQEHQGSLSYSNSIRGRTQGHPGRVIVRHKVPQSPASQNMGVGAPSYTHQREEVFLQATLQSHNLNLRLVVDTCVASPDASDFTTVKHELIQKGCIKDNSYSNLHTSGKNVAQFKFNAFSFLKSYDVVYLQCKVAVCPMLTRLYEEGEERHRLCRGQRRIS